MRSGFVGIYNQGSTCYLNSVIQALYHLPAFRTEIYNLPNVENDAVPQALRDLFAQLEVRSPNITTTNLTKAFGWSSQEAAVQHDVHELTQQLFDSLETALKGTPKQNLIREMFGGLMIYRSRAVDAIDYLSDRLEDFYDVELVVQNKTNIEESLQEFTSGERIENVSVELTPGATATPHTIERSQHFLDCPKVLLVHPNRVAFDMETYDLVTLRNVWSFDSTLSLANYLVDEKTLKLDKESEEKMRTITHRTHRGAQYTLRSILTHAGDATIGHYYVYVNFNGEWVRFNDEIVEAATEEAVLKSAFGGQSTQSRYRLFDNERASLLMYVNDEVMGEILQETPAPEDVLARGRSMDERTTAALEEHQFSYLLCSGSVVDVLDGVEGALEQQLRRVLVHIAPMQRTDTALTAALATALEVRPERLRLYFLDRDRLLAWSTVESIRNHYDSAYPHVYVDVLPESTMDSDEAELEGAGQGSILFLRGVASHDTLDGEVMIVRTARELLGSIPPNSHVFLSSRSRRRLVLIRSVDDVFSGANLLYSCVPDAEHVVSHYLKSRLVVVTSVYLYDDFTGEQRNVCCLPLEDSITYNELQDRLYHLLSQSKLGLPAAPTPRHIGFFKTSSKTSYAFAMPEHPSYMAHNTTYDRTLYDLWGRSQRERKLITTILPLPLDGIHLSVHATLNGGYKNISHIYIPTSVQELTFKLLLQLTVMQVGPRLREGVLRGYDKQLAGTEKVVRLLLVHNGELVSSTTDLNVMIRPRVDCRVMLDRLSPLLPDHVLVDVLFCRRRSREQFFGLPTNVCVSSTMSEVSDVLLRRIVKKLAYPDVEEAVKRWILCVMSVKTRKTRTASKMEVLADLVKEIGGGPFVIVVDRPMMLYLDGAEEEERQQESIVIRSGSKTDLSAL